MLRVTTLVQIGGGEWNFEYFEIALNEIYKIFETYNLKIEEVYSIKYYINQPEEEYLVEKLCEITSEENREQYLSGEYIVKAMRRD